MLMRSFRAGDWVLTPQGRLAKVEGRYAFDGARLELTYLGHGGGQVVLPEAMCRPVVQRRDPREETR